ncbi:MAG: hypothetical protein HRU33_19250 [Rhodobacteraceae bacterium]|nr:hypothetical protein [Paracoccaceae bacterium]
MNFEFDVSSFVAQSQGLTGTAMIIGFIALGGYVGRLLYVSFGSSIAAVNLFRNFSGLGLISISVGLFIAGLYLTGKQDRAVHMVQRTVIDPFTVWVLKRDACDLSSGKYCVIVFEDDREISVNWFDQEVYMWELLNPPSGAVWDTLRPRSRADLHQEVDVPLVKAEINT